MNVRSGFGQRFEGQWTLHTRIEKHDMLLGTATLADGERLGGFVGIRSKNLGTG